MPGFIDNSPRWKKFVLLSLVLASVFSFLSGRGVAAKAQNEEQSFRNLYLESLGERILVIAPHPDDETLGAGGLIHQAIQQGLEVKVVIMTFGDGFRRGAKGEYLFPEVDYVDFGRRRRLEALEAARALGLHPEDVFFLGFPDGGLNVIWEQFWGNGIPFLSSFTGRIGTPTEAHSPGSPFHSESIIKNLSGIIRQFNPTAVCMPHPEDSHPDHWATQAFAAAAICLNYRAKSFPVMLTYVIHRGLWHVLPLNRSTFVSPPNDLRECDVPWNSFIIDGDSKKAKEHALKQHASQLLISKEYLLNFVRPSELFGVLDIKRIPRVSDWPAGGWAAVPPVALDARGDTTEFPARPESDLIGLHAVDTMEGMRVFVQTAGAPSAAELRLSLYLFRGGDFRDIMRCELLIRLGESPHAEWAGDLAGQAGLPSPSLKLDRGIEVIIPTEIFGAARLAMIGACSQDQNGIIDRIGWRVISLTQ